TAIMLAAPPPTFTKILYLSDPAQALDRVDPVATGDNTATQTVVLSGSGGGGSGAIAVDRVSTGKVSGVSLTISHATGTGTNRLMLVGVAIGAYTTGARVTNVTYGTQSLTMVVTNEYNAGNQGRVEIWKLVNPNPGTSNVVIQLNAVTARPIIAGVSTFTGVDQTAPFNTTNKAAGSSLSASVTATNGAMFYGAVGVNKTTPSAALTSQAGQTNLWTGIANNGNSYASGSGDIKGGATTNTTFTWTLSATGEWAAGALGLKAAVSGGGADSSVTFTQAPAFALSFTMPSGGVVRVTNYIEVASGTMPANPAITATLGYGSNTFLTLNSPTYSASASNLVWSGSLTNNVNVPTNQSVWLQVTSSEAAATFRIRYDSATWPSKIMLPTTNVIAVTSLAVYDAPYPATNQVISAPNGATLYMRAMVDDPFGGYDISGLTMAISGPGGATAAALTDSSVVASNAASKTYEYMWYSPSVQGVYDVVATAREGTEGITNAAVTSVQLIFTDFGTPSTTVFTTGTNGPATTVYQTNETIFVRVTDADQNMNTGVVESVTVTITNTVNGDSELRTLWETGANSGVFTGGVTAVTSGTVIIDNGIMIAPAGSVLQVFYVDPNDPADVSGAIAIVPTAPGVPGLTVQKTLISPASGQALIGDTLQFQILIINSGSTTQSTVSVVDTYQSSGIAYQSALPAADTNVAGRLTWNNVGPLNPGQQVALNVYLTATNGLNPATNTAVATGTGAASTGRVTFAVLNPRVVVTKTVSTPGPLGVGQTASFEIVVHNTGNTTIMAPLPLEDSFSAAFFQFSAASPSPDGVGAGSLLWFDILNGGTLAPGASVTNNVNLLVVGGGNPAQNSAAVNYAVDNFGRDVPSSSSTTGVVTLASTISGGVFYDVHTNGLYDSTNDYGIAGVTVTLYADAAGTGTPTGLPIRITATLANGVYEFLNLPTGGYVVVEADLPGDASTGDKTAPNDNRIPVNATNLVAFTNMWFLDCTPAPTSYGTVGGTVWNDLNGDGTNNDGGVVLAGVNVDLVQDVNSNGVADVGESVIQNAATATNGTYAFGAVTPGSYVVREADPFGYLSTSTNQLGFVINGGVFSNRDFFDCAMVFSYTLTKNQTSPAGRSAVVGETLVWTIIVTNTGSMTLATLPLTDTCNTNILIYVSALPPPSTNTNGALQWNDLGPLAPGASTNVTVTMTAVGSTAGSRSTTNSVVASPATPPYDPPAGPPVTNNVPYGTAKPGVSVFKTLVSPTSRAAAAGETVTYLITVTNTGDVVLDTVPVADTFNSSLLIYLDSTPICDTLAGNVLTWTNAGSLAVGNSAVITARFTVASSGVSTNIAESSPSTSNGVPVPPATSSVT
ncbi:MAG: SdrD B-like domain-containing protein, partial [bacterium]